MKLGKFMALGLFGLTLVFAKTAGAQDSTTDNGVSEICRKLNEIHKESKGGEKCGAYLSACETNLSQLIKDKLIEKGCSNRQLVDCPPDDPIGQVGGDCFEGIVDPICEANAIFEARETIIDQINGECTGNPPTTPPVDPADPKEPKDPQDPKNRVPPVVQPEQPEIPTDPFQVGDNNQGQAAGGLFQLSGSGCSLNLAGAESATFLNGFWLLLPLLGLRKKK